MVWTVLIFAGCAVGLGWSFWLYYDMARHCYDEDRRAGLKNRLPPGA